MHMPHHLLAVGLLALFGVPVLAQPALDLVELGPNSVALQILADDSGSLATELVIRESSGGNFGNLQLTGAVVTEPLIFDTPIPGNNPLTGTVTHGLYLDGMPSNEVFASYGSAVVASGAIELLTITFVGRGPVEVTGRVAQRGVAYDVRVEAPLNVLAGDFDFDGDVDGADFLRWSRDLGGFETLASWQDHFGSVEASTATIVVPEGSAGMLLAIGLSIIPVRRLRRRASKRRGLSQATRYLDC